MKLNSLVRSPSGIVVLETILVACLMFGTFAVLVRVTDMETVGLWGLVNSLLGFSRAADFWSRGLSSFVGEARGKGETTAAAGFVSTAVLSGVVGYGILAVVGASVIFTFAQQIAGDAHAEKVRDIIPLMAITFWFLSICGIYQGSFLAFGRPLLKAGQTVGGAILFLLLAVLLAPEYGLLGILIAQALQGVAMLGYSILVFHGFVARKHASSWRRDQFRQLAAFGGKAIVVGIVHLAIDPVIRLLASQFGGLGTVAIVELASRLIAVVRSVITALGQILVPEFARLGASAAVELVTLSRDMNRLFLVASLSAFSLLASAAPVLEEILLGESGTGFVVILWILSLGWFANTVTSSAYFLLLARRQLRPLFWSHFIMTVGTILLGTAGGLMVGIYGAVAGAATAIVASSIYLAMVVDEVGSGFDVYITCLLNEPTRLLPAVVAVGGVSMLELSGVMQGEVVVRALSYGGVIVVTMVTCLVFGDVRSLIRMAASVGWSDQELQR